MVAYSRAFMSSSYSRAHFYRRPESCRGVHHQEAGLDADELKAQAVEDSEANVEDLMSQLNALSSA